MMVKRYGAEFLGTLAIVFAPVAVWATGGIASGAAVANLWLYLIVPSVGAVLAARTYELLRLHPEHATGAPNELLGALEDIRSEASI